MPWIKELTVELLRELISYEPESGKLFWRHRHEKHFKDDAEAFLWNAKHAGSEIRAKPGAGGYRSLCVFNKTISHHRLAWVLHYGVFPDGDIDHVNGVTKDNRIQNLRDVTPQVNSRNVVLHRDNPNTHAGVRKRKDGSWEVWLLKKKLGIYASEDEAVKAREQAQVSHGFTLRNGKPRIEDYGFKHLRDERKQRMQAKKEKKKAAALLFQQQMREARKFINPPVAPSRIGKEG